jgi:hypothetical protein
MLGGILWRFEFVVASQIFSTWLFNAANGELAGLKKLEGWTRKSGCKQAIRTGRHGGRVLLVLNEILMLLKVDWRYETISFC